jgi:hypothetical protein
MGKIPTFYRFKGIKLSCDFFDAFTQSLAFHTEGLLLTLTFVHDKVLGTKKIDLAGVFYEKSDSCMRGMRIEKLFYHE